MHRVRLVVALFVALTLAAVVACGDEDQEEVCRFEPDKCDGYPGAFCGSDRDCATGFCCREDKNCGGGMCTYECKDDRDCPAGMGCEHDVCFYTCRYDEDCAVGQSCEHGNTVCEWR